MSKTIKLEDKVYDELEIFRDKRETFSEAVEGLLAARLKVLELFSILEGQLKYREWQLGQKGG